jgi:hypothetical protein
MEAISASKIILKMEKRKIFFIAVKIHKNEKITLAFGGCHFPRYLILLVLSVIFALSHIAPQSILSSA